MNFPILSSLILLPTVGAFFLFFTRITTVISFAGSSINAANHAPVGPLKIDTATGETWRFVVNGYDEYWKKIGE